jgi:glycosyltransferase involved in cell wall biosynthesis
MLQIPFVSICCITYNHSTYITDCIEGFLMQKTTFPFEIIIHDDASTDGTTEIIRSYAINYPNLIFPIYQNENQYSKKSGSIEARFVYPKAHGKYIALCEGDDFWTDPYKLQKQIDELQKHPNCNICFHPVLKVNEATSKKDEIIANYGDLVKIFSAAEVIVGGGSFMPTVSIVLNRYVIENLPEWFMQASVEDYFLQILGSLNGGALYFNETMAVYRANLKGSWTNKMNNKDFQLNFYLLHLETLELADTYIKTYADEFMSVKRVFTNLVLKDRSFEIKAKKDLYKKQCKNLNLRDKLLWNLVYSVPSVRNTLSKFKKLIRYTRIAN